MYDQTRSFFDNLSNELKKDFGRNPLLEGVSELIHEIPGLTPREKKLFQWGLESEVISNEFPPYGQLMDELTELPIADKVPLGGDEAVFKGGKIADKADVHSLYMRHVLLPHIKQKFKEANYIAFDPDPYKEDFPEEDHWAAGDSFDENVVKEAKDVEQPSQSKKVKSQTCQICGTTYEADANGDWRYEYCPADGGELKNSEGPYQAEELKDSDTENEMKMEEKVVEDRLSTMFAEDKVEQIDKKLEQLKVLIRQYEQEQAGTRKSSRGWDLQKLYSKEDELNKEKAILLKQMESREIKEENKYNVKTKDNKEAGTYADNAIDAANKVEDELDSDVTEVDFAGCVSEGKGYMGYNPGDKFNLGDKQFRMLEVGETKRHTVVTARNLDTNQVEELKFVRNPQNENTDKDSYEVKATSVDDEQTAEDIARKEDGFVVQDTDDDEEYTVLKKDENNV